MFCFIFVVNLNNNYSWYHLLGRHLTFPWSFRASLRATSCIPHGRQPTHPWSFRAPLNASVVFTGVAPRALDPSGHRPTRPLSFRVTHYETLCKYSVLVGANQRTVTPLVLPGAAPCALGPSRRRPTPRDAVAARLRWRPPQEYAIVATEKGQPI